MKYFSFFIAILFALINVIKAQNNFSDTVSLITYNLNNFGFASTKSCPLEGSPLKPGYLRTILKYLNAPDIVSFQKFNGTPKTLASDSIKRTIMDSICLNCYGVVDFTNNSGYKKVNTLYYKNSKFGYLGTVSIYSADNNISDINLHKLYYKSPSLVTNHDTIYLNVIVVHDESGASSASKRATELSGAMSWMSANVKTAGNFVFMGDFNTQSSTEACFQILTNPKDSILRFYDPPNQLGNWSGSPTSFAKYLTQSTRSTDIGDCASNNTMLARFDHILCTNPIMQGTQSIKYIPGTFNVVGQDGLHTGKALIDAPTNVSVPPDVLSALYNMSEHLPVQLKLLISKQNPLPIGFIVTDVSWLNNKPYIQWQNNSNMATANYTIEKSKDGNNFQKLETIVPTNYSNSYTYIDNAQMDEEIIYYRIKQVLKDGSSVYSKTITLKNTILKMTVAINPNPVKNKLTVTIGNSSNTQATVQIINACGQTCISQKTQLHLGNNTLSTNSIEHLAKGMYVLKIQTNKELVSKVFIKE